MLSRRRPTDAVVLSYRTDRLLATPTGEAVAVDTPGFRHESWERVVGRGEHDFARAGTGLRLWAAHRGSGVEVYPADAGLSEGATVALLTRQLGIWVLAACRVVEVIDRPQEFGFTYATLPDHPECGVESFTIRMIQEDVHIAIEAVSKPGNLLVALGAPVTRVLQRRATVAYLDAIERWMGSAASGEGGSE